MEQQQQKQTPPQQQQRQVEPEETVSSLLAAVTDETIRQQADALRMDCAAARLHMASGLYGEAKWPLGLAKILAGRELGIGPVASLRGVHVFETGGRLRMSFSSEILGTLLKRGGYDWTIVEHTAEVCTLHLFRYGAGGVGGSIIELGEKGVPAFVSFGKADAERAHLVERARGKEHKDQPVGTYDQYPSDMYFARCIARCIRRYAPHLLNGQPPDDEFSAASVDNGNPNIEDLMPRTLPAEVKA